MTRVTTIKPCQTCHAPSDAARFVARHFQTGGNRNPSLGLLLDAAGAGLREAQDRSAIAGVLVAACEARLAAAGELARTTATRAAREAADAGKPLPIVLAEQVKASAEAAQRAHDAAQAAASAITAELAELRSEAATLAAELARVSLDTFTEADLLAALGELGLVVDGGRIASVTPTAEQARARDILAFYPTI